MDAFAGLFWNPFRMNLRLVKPCAMIKGMSGWKIMHAWFRNLFLSIPKAHLYYICYITTPQAYVFLWTLQCPHRIYPGNIVMLLQGHLPDTSQSVLLGYSTYGLDEFSTYISWQRHLYSTKRDTWYHHTLHWWCAYLRSRNALYAGQRFIWDNTWEPTYLSIRMGILPGS
jgi:hypothetical protein